MDPFQAALDALFNAPGSLAATYHSAADAPAPIRVIVSRPDDTVTFRGSRIVQSTYEITFRKSEVPEPLKGEAIVVDGGQYLSVSGVLTDALHLMGDPQLDVEGLTWACGADPA